MLPSSGAVTCGRSTGGVGGLVVVVVVLVLGRVSRAAARRTPPGPRAVRRSAGSRRARCPSSWSTTTMVAPPLATTASVSGDRLLADQVDTGVGLVEDQQLGLAGQRARDQHPLLLAPGQRRRPGAGHGPRGPPPPVRARPRPGRCARVGTNGRRRERRPAATTSATVDGHPLGDRRALGHVAQPVPLANSASGSPNRPDRPALSGCSPTIALTSVDLPGAVGAEQRDHLAGVHAQVDVAHDRSPAQGDRGAARPRPRRCRGSRMQPRRPSASAARLSRIRPR